MPYIKKVQRSRFDTPLKLISDMEPSEGELNYCITKLCHGTEPRNYADFNRIIGVLESAKLEFYRKMVVPYEELKENENGKI